jgi:hypothetical protein
MTPAPAPNLYKHHRFSGEIISHAVWLYFRFPLSHRDSVPYFRCYASLRPLPARHER